MDQLPELKTGRSLSWKVQENSEGLLIQLVWKAEPESGPASGNTIRSRVGSNWKSSPELVSHTVDGKAAGEVVKNLVLNLI